MTTEATTTTTAAATTQNSGQAAGGEAGSATATATAPWYQSANDVELIGYIQNRGWDKLPPAEAAVQAAKAHREASKFMGVPQEQILRLPANSDDVSGWRGVWERLGAPKNADEYEFAPQTGEEFRKVFSKVAFENGLSKAAATRVAQSITEGMAALDAREEQEANAKLEAEHAALKSDWGMHLEDNMFVARQAAKAFGVSPETLDAMQGSLGYKKVMDLFLNIGRKIGEDRFIVGSRGEAAPGGVTTREQAAARKAELMRDSAFIQRLFAGGKTEKQEIAHLSRLIVGA